MKTNNKKKYNKFYILIKYNKMIIILKIFYYNYTN